MESRTPHLPDSPTLRFLLIRTFKTLKGGGPVPPMGLLMLAGALRQAFADKVDVRILDTGLLSGQSIADQIARVQPDYVGLSSMSCEEDVLCKLARTVRERSPRSCVLAGGPHASVAPKRLLVDSLVDFVVVGEAERTLIELVRIRQNGGDPASVDGIVFARDGRTVATAPRAAIEDLDALPFPAWDLVDLNAYARLPNWSGLLKGKPYATLFSSRGCPYGCTFCHNVFGKRWRARSPASIVTEATRLVERFGVRELHILDDVFNLDAQRAQDVCRGLIEARLPLALAFPNGLRADIMNDELIGLLRRAGTYKINYGFETTSPRLQKMIGKNLDIAKAVETFDKTARSGIITGAYFMLGFPTQTRDEILDTIRFAADSNLDVGYFFKATPYPGSPFFDATNTDLADGPDHYADLHFYSVDRSYGEVEATELNRLLLFAQQTFYLKFRRLWRGFRKTPRKRIYLKNLMTLFALVLQGILVRNLAKPAKERKA